MNINDRGLWRHADFMKLWTGQTISQFGSTVTRNAMPLAALLLLGATPLQMGLLAAVGSAPVLLVALFAGVWVDRRKRRPVMIVADLSRAVLLLSIPIAALFGRLRLEQLFIVAPLVGGGEHDWAHILSRWGSLQADTLLAWRLSTFAWLGVIITWGLVARLWLRAKT